ncbi:MAG: DUF1203 domain-containing protein [Gemmatimonadaceae bacterium]|nr:DUF1203 domain-containing protein [Gemmatimonadaceae bacterium]
MPSFVVRPISGDITQQVRTTRRSPQYGHPVHEEVARGTGPCRACLRAFTVGVDRRLLFTYSPFEEASLPQPGPVFIHADACAPHAGVGYPAGLAQIPVVAQPYHDDGSIAAPCAIPLGEEAATLATLLASPRVRFIHLRHAEAGCFIGRVERAGA